jgi:hypothetical protein
MSNWLNLLIVPAARWTLAVTVLVFPSGGVLFPTVEMSMQEYRGFVLFDKPEDGLYRISIAHPDGRIFSIGCAFSRCFYTDRYATIEEAEQEAKLLIDDELDAADKYTAHRAANIN